MFGYHAPLWCIPIMALELVVDLYVIRIKSWLRKIRGISTAKEQKEEERILGKVVVITGANSGIGKHTAIAMGERGATVVMGCRDLGRGELARKEIMEKSNSKTVELYRLDLSDLETVRKFARDVRRNHPVIDILINNAGISLNHRVQSRTKEGWNLSMTTNRLGHFILTNLLVDAILASEIRRVVAVSSTALFVSSLDTNDLMMQKSDDLGLCNQKPYQNSKFALSLFTKLLGKRYPTIKTYCMCPGFVDADIFKKYEMIPMFAVGMPIVLTLFLQSVESGVENVLLCALAKRTECWSGGFVRFGKRVKLIERMLKEETAEKVWAASDKFAGLV